MTELEEELIVRSFKVLPPLNKNHQKVIAVVKQRLES